MYDDKVFEFCAWIIAILSVLVGIMYFCGVDSYNIGKTITSFKSYTEQKFVIENNKQIIIYKNDNGSIKHFKEFNLTKGNYIIISKKNNNDETFED